MSNRAFTAKPKLELLTTNRPLLTSFLRYRLVREKPNAAPQPLPKAGARHEQTLEAVGCRRWLAAQLRRACRLTGVVPAWSVAGPSAPAGSLAGPLLAGDRDPQ